ncbi:zinc-binding dehydrogenase [Sphingobium herbicidovorans]
MAAVDIDDSKLDLATRLGATLTVNAHSKSPSAALKKAISSARGALVTAVSPEAFQQALGMVRRGGTVALNDLHQGDFPLSIFDTVLNGITVQGSIVGTRLDLLKALAFTGDGKVKATVHPSKLENIDDVFSRMHHGDIEGRIVLDLA